MWQRLSVLALGGMSALWADVCGGLPTGDPKAFDFWGSTDRQPPAVAFQLSVKRGGPAFRIRVRPIPFRYEGDGVAVHAGDIEVARCQDGKQLQLLPIMAWQPIDFGASFHADDINFDGYLDFSVLTEFAARWRSRAFWVYDPGSGLFVQNELTRTLEGDAPTGWKGLTIDLDPKKHEIKTFHAEWNCETDENHYRVQNNRPILVHQESGSQAPRRGADLPDCIVTVSDLIGGTMRVTAVRRFNAQGEPVK
jgi:hypothetical protein